jgi:hypothetical protein
MDHGPRQEHVTAHDYQGDQDTAITGQVFPCLHWTIRVADKTILHYSHTFAPLPLTTRLPTAHHGSRVTRQSIPIPLRIRQSPYYGKSPIHVRRTQSRTI